MTLSLINDAVVRSNKVHSRLRFSRWKVSAKIQQLLNTLKKPKRRPLPEFYEDDDKVIKRRYISSHQHLLYSVTIFSRSLSWQQQQKTLEHLCLRAQP